MTLEYKGIKIHYKTSGKGQPLILLHGFLGNASMWDGIIPFFNKDYHCVSIDLLGHGRTGCLGYIHTMEDMAQAVNAILSQLHIDNANFIGHSMGGYVALAYTDLYPKAVNTLGLLNSTSLPDNKERKLNRDRAIAIVKKNPKAYTSMAIANLFAEKNRNLYTREIEYIKNQAVTMPIQGIISALEGMKIRKDRHHILTGFTGNKIIFTGTKDPVLPHEKSINEAEKCNTRIVSFNGGHMSYLENRIEFLEVTKQFLEQK